MTATRRQSPARNIVPVDRLLHEDDALRFRHADLSGLTDTQLWAERVLVEPELARLVFNGHGPIFLDEEQTDQTWLAARAGRLRDELARRKARGGRHAA